jgi:glutamate formiminotransferase
VRIRAGVQTVGVRHSLIYLKGNDHVKNIETRKTIALAMAGAYILFTGYCIVTGKVVPAEFIGIVGPIIGYYFGKSTVLEKVQ